jgi:hypothetical protein
MNSEQIIEQYSKNLEQNAWVPICNQGVSHIQILKIVDETITINVNGFVRKNPIQHDVN